MSTFLKLFHSSETRDVAVYGIAAYDEDGLLIFPGPNFLQKTAAVVRACEDVLACVGRMLSTHGRAILGYALWYKDRHKHDEETYADYIAGLACHCIIESDFIVPNAVWTVVK